MDNKKIRMKCVYLSLLIISFWSCAPQEYEGYELEGLTVSKYIVKSNKLIKVDSFMGEYEEYLWVLPQLKLVKAEQGFWDTRLLEPIDSIISISIWGLDSTNYECVSLYQDLTFEKTFSYRGPSPQICLNDLGNIYNTKVSNDIGYVSKNRMMNMKNGILLRSKKFKSFKIKVKTNRVDEVIEVEYVP